MTKLMYSKEESRQANLRTEALPLVRQIQILHLKRLLVTLKQHYEKSLHCFANSIASRTKSKDSAAKRTGKCQAQAIESQKLHEEELQALRNQQTSLKRIIKKTQEELKQAAESPLP